MDEYGPDPVARFKQACKERTAAKEAESAEAVTIEIHRSRRSTSGRWPEEHRVGGAPGRLQRPGRRDRHPQRHQGLERRLRRERRHEAARHREDLGPGIQEARLGEQGQVLFRTEFSLDDTYRALDPICACRDRIVSAINRAVDKMGIRGTACVYYDVTNYYFEGRRAGRSEAEGRVKGTLGTHRADGPAAGLRRHPDRLQALARQYPRPLHDAPRPPGHEGATTGASASSPSATRATAARPTSPPWSREGTASCTRSPYAARSPTPS